MRSILRCKFSTPTSTSLYSGIISPYAQNPVFKSVHDESVKVYPHMYNGNVQQNPLCVESCVTKEFSMSPRFLSTIFDPDANSVLLRAHLCTAVDSMRKKPCVRNCSRKRERLYNGNVQQNPLCAASCVTKDIYSHRSPVLACVFLSRCKFSTPTSTSLYSCINTLYVHNPVFEIVHDESVNVYPHIHVQRECSAEPSMRTDAATTLETLILREARGLLAPPNPALVPIAKFLYRPGSCRWNCSVLILISTASPAPMCTVQVDRAHSYFLCGFACSTTRRRPGGSVGNLEALLY